MLEATRKSCYPYPLSSIPYKQWYHPEWSITFQHCVYILCFHLFFSVNFTGEFIVQFSASSIQFYPISIECHFMTIFGCCATYSLYSTAVCFPCHNEYCLLSKVDQLSGHSSSVHFLLQLPWPYLDSLLFIYLYKIITLQSDDIDSLPQQRKGTRMDEGVY